MYYLFINKEKNYYYCNKSKDPICRKITALFTLTLMAQKYVRECCFAALAIFLRSPRAPLRVAGAGFWYKEKNKIKIIL